MCKHFQTKDLGSPKYFLGIEILVKRCCNLLKYAPNNSSMDLNQKLMTEEGASFYDQKRYRRLVGKQNYLTITRLNLSIAIGCRSIHAASVYWP